VEVAEHPGIGELTRRALDRGELARVRGLDADVDVVRVDGERADRGAGDDLIRIASHDRTVLERPRLAFGPVHHDIATRSRGVSHRAPLATGGEAATTASPQSG